MGLNVKPTLLPTVEETPMKSIILAGALAIFAIAVSAQTSLADCCTGRVDKEMHNR